MRPLASAPPIRIVHVVDSLEPGGLERVTCDLAMAQARAGHMVSVFSLQRTEGFKDELLAAGIPVIEGCKSKSLDWPLLRKLRRWVREQSADIVHAHNFVPNYHAALACLLLPGPRPAQVCTIHDMGMRLSQRKLRWLFLASLKRTQKVAMVGQRVHERFVRDRLVDPAMATTVLNGIPVRRFARRQEGFSSARREVGIPESATLIGCVGRLVPLKNHRRMINVFSRLLPNNPDLRLIIIGDGECREALSEQVSSLGLNEHVTLFGHHPQVARLLPALDIFALPSQTEGLSIALLEACASELAIVATSVGGNPDIIQDEQTGLLVPPDDNDALRVAIQRMLDSPALRCAMGARAREWVSQNASDEALESAYERCYREALNNLRTA